MRVLLVEDHLDSLQLMSRILKAHGHEVVTAQTLSEARNICESEEFGLLLCDIKLPDGDGWELAEKARERGVPAVAVTGLGMPHDVKRSRESGFSAHLLKPIDIRELEQTIRTVTQNQNVSKSQFDRQV